MYTVPEEGGYLSTNKDFNLIVIVISNKQKLFFFYSSGYITSYGIIDLQLVIAL